MHYRNTQVGKVTNLTVATIVIVTLVITFLVEIDPPLLILLPLGFALFMTLLLVCFGKLTVEVTGEHVCARFGPGWVRKRFAIDEIYGVERVRNRWYWGWGVRLTPHGWMFNISGLDAVEITLTGGKRFRIGTDQPREFEAAIRRAMSMRDRESTAKE